MYRLTNLEYLEIVFLDAVTQNQYLEKGLQICGFKLSSYNNFQNRNFLTINLNSVSIMDAEAIRTLIPIAITNIASKNARLHSFYPLIVPDILFLTNQ